MWASVVLREPESRFTSVSVSGAMAAQCCIIIRNCGSRVGDVIDTQRCTGVCRRRLEVRREIGEKCSILSHLLACLGLPDSVDSLPRRENEAPRFSGFHLLGERVGTPCLQPTSEVGHTSSCNVARIKVKYKIDRKSVV